MNLNKQKKRNYRRSKSTNLNIEIFEHNHNLVLQRKMRWKRLWNTRKPNNNIQATRTRRIGNWKERRTYDRDMRARPYPRSSTPINPMQDEIELDQIIDEIIGETIPINNPINQTLIEETTPMNNPINQTPIEEDILADDLMDQTSFENFDNIVTSWEESEEFRSDIEDLEANLFLSSTPTDNPIDQDILMTAEEERIHHLEELLKTIRNVENPFYELKHEIIITQLLRRARLQTTTIHNT